MTFLEKLDGMMLQKKLNKHTLSKQSEIPYTTIDGWYKKGYDGMKLGTLIKLSDFFEVPLGYWIQDNENNSSSSPKDEKELLKEETLLNALIGFGWINERNDLSDEDFLFLNHIVGLLDAWFSRYSN